MVGLFESFAEMDGDGLARHVLKFSGGAQRRTAPLLPLQQQRSAPTIAMQQRRCPPPPAAPGPHSLQLRAKVALHDRLQPGQRVAADALPPRLQGCGGEGRGIGFEGLRAVARWVHVPGRPPHAPMRSVARPPTTRRGMSILDRRDGEREGRKGSKI